MLFYNALGKQIPYSSRREPHYVLVIKLPDDRVNHIFEEVAPEHLYNTIWMCKETGWYYQDDDEVWRCLNKVKKELANIENFIRKISDAGGR